jgi:hypothetical protein
MPELLFASDKSMKYFASLLILIGSFMLIWSASEIFFSMNSNENARSSIDNAFGTPWSGLLLIAIGGSLLIYLKSKVR